MWSLEYATILHLSHPTEFRQLPNLIRSYEKIHHDTEIAGCRAYDLCTGVLLVATAVIAQARMDCTKVPRNHWMGRVAISQIAHASGYPVIKAISLEGSCYKVTALTALGLKADAYFNPVTGDVTAAWISVD